MAIICHCEAVKERTIVHTIRRGACSVGEVAELCGAASRCGGCWDSVDALVALHAQPATRCPAASVA